MTLDRRAFLQFASASPLVFGLDSLFAATQSPEPPDWWKTALNRMKDLGRPGLVFIAPEAEAGSVALGTAIRDLLESEDSRAREMFCGAVVVCLSHSIAEACLPKDGDSHRVLLLDPSGRVIERADLVLVELKDPGAFEERFSKLLYGGSRLSESADRLRATLTDEEKAAFAKLTAESASTLAKNAEALMPLLIFERRTSKDPERAARLRKIIDSRFESADEKTPGPRLPFGAYYETPRGGCAAEDDNGAIQCGMAKLEGKGRRFLRFLTQ
jgi:hypothetical protein